MQVAGYRKKSSTVISESKSSTSLGTITTTTTTTKSLIPLIVVALVLSLLLTSALLYLALNKHIDRGKILESNVSSAVDAAESWTVRNPEISLPRAARVGGVEKENVFAEDAFELPTPSEHIVIVIESSAPGAYTVSGTDLNAMSKDGKFPTITYDSKTEEYATEK